MIQWKSIGRLLAPAALVLALPGTVLAADCAEFQGIEHCAIGKARLDTAGSGLEVTGFGTAGTDGVRMSLEGATFWEMGTRLKGNAAGDSSFVVTAFASGAPNSQMIVRQDRSRFSVGAQFTGSSGGSGGGGGRGTSAVLVFLGGNFQGGMGRIPHTSYTWVMPPELEPGDGSDYWPIGGSGFGVSPQTGGCIHTLSLNTGSDILLPNGQVLRGDYIEIVEEVAASGSYPYMSFDAVEMTGKLNSLTITSETVQK